MSEQPAVSNWLEADWPAPSRVHAGTTTREGGCSRGPFESLNLGTHVGDDPDAVAQNRKALRRRLDLPAEPLWLEQMHGTRVYDPENPENVRADAARSDDPGTVCAILTADCVPVLICNRQGTEIAGVHAGWRGLSAGIIPRVLAAFQDTPDSLLAWLGPHIGPDHYVVGHEVRNACLRSIEAARGGFSGGGAGRWHADLGYLVRSALGESGVTACFGGGHCTFACPELFYSYRRDGQTGRMASLIWMEARE